MQSYDVLEFNRMTKKIYRDQHQQYSKGCTKKSAEKYAQHIFLKRKHYLISSMNVQKLKKKKQLSRLSMKKGRHQT